MAITIKLDDAQRALLINVILGGARPKNKSEAFQHQRIYEALDFRSVVRGGVEGEPKEFELDRPDFDTLYDEADSKVFERQALVGAQGVVYKPMIEALKAARDAADDAAKTEREAKREASQMKAV